MTAKVINDPSALGWEYDPDTGRWTWGGSGGGSNGGGGGSFPEAPVDGLQYGRQNAGWTEIVSTGGGGDVDLSDYYTITETDDKFQVKGNYLTEFTEEDPTVPSHVKAITTTDIDKWNNPPTGGGGGAVDSVNGKTGAVNLTYSDVGAQVAGSYLVSSDLNGYATQTWVGQNYQVKGSYAASNHNHSGVYQPAGNYATASHTHAYVPTSGNTTISGTLTATDFIATSDRNKKDNIQTASTGFIEQIRGVTFNWKDTGAEASGVIAQELQEVGLGHLVHEDDDGLKVSYNGLTAYLIEEVKALKAEIKAMKQ